MTKRKWLLKFLRLFIIAAVILLVGLQKGSFFGSSFGQDEAAAATLLEGASLAEAKVWFEDAKRFEKNEFDELSVYDGAGNLLGYILSSKPYSDSIIGYAGPVHFIMGVTAYNKLLGIKLTEHVESPGYITFIENAGFFSNFENKSIHKVVEQPIDAVSGATLTCDAITEAAKKRLATHIDIIVELEKGQKKKVGKLLSILVILLALCSFFFKAFKKYRLLLLISSIAVLGFYQGTFISMFLLQGWVYSGIPAGTQWLLTALVGLSILLPFVFNKSFYCNYLCPYGAAQELAGRFNKKRKGFPFRKTIFIKYLREMIFAVLIIMVVSGFNIDLTNVEPFTAFVFRSASWAAIILALVFLVLSFFFNKPWCYHFCPTGQFLAFFRISKKH